MIIFTKLYNILRFFKFGFNILREGVFSNKDPEQILTLILLLVKSECLYYNKKKIVMSRTIETSTKLLESLIKTYRETHSEVTLNQILQVLKEEFIKRK